VDTGLSYLFPIAGQTEEEAVGRAVRNMMTGREGLFVLVSNRPLTASGTLVYRAMNDIETTFRDLKHGIDRRPAGCTSEDSVRGRVLISFLALFCMSMIRFLYPEFGSKTAESIAEELSSFSLTVLVGDRKQKKCVFGNFGKLIRLVRGQKAPERVPEAPGQATIGSFSK
jgi:transposase